MTDDELRRELKVAKAENARLTVRAVQLYEALEIMVGYLHEEASDGDGIREEHWDGFQAAKALLTSTELRPAFVAAIAKSALDGSEET